uniref:Holliday junction resolvase RuvC n=1 Tax=viral metagenome TaxID=1070528 RepID=A0A6M3XHK4_9ZZZZ
MRVLAIDPGPELSAWVLWDGETIGGMNISNNQELINNPYLWDLKTCGADVLVVEKIMSYGMTVSTSIFDTVFWTGRFCQAWGGEFFRVPRMEVKMHFCHNSRAKDSNIRQAILDRFEPDLKPRQRPKGILKGVSRDIWAALAVAIYWIDLHGEVKEGSHEI